MPNNKQTNKNICQKLQMLPHVEFLEFFFWFFKHIDSFEISSQLNNHIAHLSDMRKCRFSTWTQCDSISSAFFEHCDREQIMHNTTKKKTDEKKCKLHMHTCSTKYTTIGNIHIWIYIILFRYTSTISHTNLIDFPNVFFHYIEKKKTTPL